MHRNGLIQFTGAAACVASALIVAAWTAAAEGETPAADPGPPSNAVARLKMLSMEELMEVEVATVTTVSKKPETARDAPATTRVLDRRDIELRGYSTLTDLLRDMPGMETIPYYFSEVGTLVPVRGIVGNNKIVVLVNGMRVNPPGGEFFPFRGDFSVRQADRVEVVYGPGSTLYGQDAISAVINVITREPESVFGGEAGGATGFDNEQELWGWAGGRFGPDGQFRLSAYAQYHRSDLTRIDKDYPDWWRSYRDVSRAAQPAGQGDPPYREDEGLNVFARASSAHSSLQVWLRQSERSSSEGFNPILGYLPAATWGDASLVVEGRNELPLRDGVRLVSSICYNHYEIDPSTRYVFPVPAEGGAVTNWFLNDYKYGIGASFSGEETLQWEIAPAISLLAGVAAATYDITPKSTVPGGADPTHDISSQGGAFVYIDPLGRRREIQRVVQERYETVAGYLEAGWQMLPRLKAIAGARATQDTRFDALTWTPRAALIYNLAANLTAKYIFTRAYVAPGPYFGYATYDNGRLLADSNPDLAPEIAVSHELNLDYSRRNLNVGASFFYGEESDLLILADMATPANVIYPEVILPDGSTRTLVRTVNGGESSNVGVTLYGRGTCGVISPWVSYTYVEFEQTIDGVSSGLAGASRHNGRLGATWAALPRLYLTPSLAIRSRPENVRPGTLGHELDLPYDVRLHALYKVAPRVDVFADVRNLTDHTYALGGVTGDAVPQETFSAAVGTRIRF